MKKMIIVAGALIVALVLLFVYIGPQLGLAETFHTGIPESDVNWMETEHYETGSDPWGHWDGNVEPDYTELILDLTNSPIVTAYENDPNILSEQVSVEGTLTWDGGPLGLWAPVRGWYTVDIRDAQHQTWFNIASGAGADGHGHGSYTIDTNYIFQIGGNPGPHEYQGFGIPVGEHQRLPAFNFKMKGQHVGALRVQHYVIYTNGITESDVNLASEDWVYLISGAGDINLCGYPEGYMFEVGETVPICVSVDYSGQTGTGEGHWELRYFPLSGDPGGVITTFGDYVRTQFNWVLPTNIWYRGISNSQVRLELWNTLFPQDHVDINTIDLRAKAPPTPTVILSKSNPQTGETITVTGACYTNPETHLAIANFISKCTYTDTGQQFFYKTDIVPVGADPFTYSFITPPFPRAGPFKIEVWGRDTDGRQSQIQGVATGEAHSGEYRLNVKVMNEYNSQPIEGASVTLNPGSEQKETGSDGIVTYQVMPGSFSVDVYKEGFQAKHQSFTVSSDPTNIDVFLTQTQVMWSLKVTVKDEGGGAIPFATVKVGSAATGTTVEDGTITFHNLPEGDYLVTAQKNELSGEQTISLHGNKDITIVVRPGGAGMNLDLVKLAIGGAIIGILTIVSLLWVPGGIIWKVVVILIGVVVAIAIYLLM